MCKNCGIVSSAFQAAQAEHFAALHAMLNTMVKNGQLQLLAGDCPLEDMPMCCVRKNITRCAFIWSVPPAGKCISSAAASGASPFTNAWAIPAGKPSTAICGAIFCGGRREHIINPRRQGDRMKKIFKRAKIWYN